MDPDESPVATLLPELPEPLRSFDVTVCAPREDSDALVPALVPKGSNVLSVCTAEQVIVCVTVRAGTLLEAAVLGLAAAGEVARMPGASAEVKPVPRHQPG